jgi:hypothetical protein
MPIATLSGASLADVHQALETKLPAISNISHKHCHRWQSISAVAFTDCPGSLASEEIELGGAR